MSINPGPQLPGRDGYVWKEQVKGGHAVAPERAENERLLAEAGISRRVPVWAWALVAAIVVGLVLVFVS